MKSEDDFAHRLMWVLWPAFLVAGAAEFAFFSAFDPSDLVFRGAPLELSRPAVYTIGFFAFWVLGAASSALTVFLERSPFDRRPRPGEEAR
ncbi:MAG: hypothetical protein IT519_00180 [Burkholderiales bacterium]|jgi:hypothetical protein|nr:hypothetical protein [Burkholderiales bacterium]